MTVFNVVRLNQFGIQMLPDRLQKAVFPDAKNSTVPEALVELSRAHLKQNDLPIDSVRPALPIVEPEIPPLAGSNIEEHFWQLGARLGSDFFALIDGFVTGHSWPDKFAAGHFKWDIEVKGWSQYDVISGDRIGSVDFPKEQLLVFDVETCKAFTDGKAPLIAIAMSCKYLYAWISPCFNSETAPGMVVSKEKLIPFGPSPQESLLVGHNVSFDRARIREEYDFDNSQYKRRFLDTLSMHSAVGGISSQQRMQWTKYKKERNGQSDEEGTSSELLDDEAGEDQQTTEWALWYEKGSMANLADTVRLHCNGLTMDKSPRDLLMTELDPSVIQSSLPLLLDYCVNDVAATASLVQSLWPKFLSKCPHPVTFTAMLEMTTAYLPVDGRWKSYVERCESMLKEAKFKIESSLASLAQQRLAELPQKDDEWMGKLDWTPVPEKFTKARYKKDGTFAKGGEPRPIGNVELFVMPAWYRKLYNAQTKEVTLTTKARIVPYLLKMKWNGYPVHFVPSAGWCYNNPAGGDEGLVMDPAYPGTKLYRVPHAKDQGANVGCLLSKDYLSAYEKGILTTPNDSTEIVKAVLDISTRFSFWTGYRERIRDGQMVVYEEGEQERGTILPQCIPMGTVTRRAVEGTWMTASNPKPNLVGSELKSLITAPPGWSIVGADVDSQELWIASLLGDSQFGLTGSTAVSWMTLQGTKSDGTDLHSKTASLLGMTRDAAKIFTYGRIYGAGAKYAAQLLQKYDPTLDQKAAADKARLLYHATKGRKSFGESQEDERIYIGGSESFMFNQLEAIARSPISRTPALSAAISDALLSSSVQEEYLTSRINWAVQSSGVDYLHMLLVSMQYLIKLHAIPARLLLTIHDEVRYLVREDHQYRLAFCLQIANLWTRAMFVHRLGIHELPLSVAFFSAVDFDHVLRKEPGITCQTPSNPNAIPPGHSLDIYGLLEKVGKTGGLDAPSEQFIEWWNSRRLLPSPTILPTCKQSIIPSISFAERLSYLQKQAAIKKPARRQPEPQPQAAASQGNPPQERSKDLRPTVAIPTEEEAKAMNKWKRLLNRPSDPKTPLK